MDKARSFSTESRLKQAEAGGAIKVFLIVQILLSFAFSIAIAVSAGYYLFNVEIGVECVAANKENGSSLKNVHKRFR